jgi:uncharacterized membrane protein YhaH (DUF805 family)
MSENVYNAPESDVLVDSGAPVELTPKQILFSFKGRIRRSNYWIYSIGITVAAFVAMFVLGAVLGFVGGNESILNIFALVLYIPLIWCSLAIQVKRWHDRNKSGWWVLITLIPLIGAIWALIENGFLEGTPGPNDYGPSPK